MRKACRAIRVWSSAEILRNSATVSTWPEAIFAVGASIYFLAFATLLVVRVRRPKWQGYSESAVRDPGASGVSAFSS